MDAPVKVGYHRSVLPEDAQPDFRPRTGRWIVIALGVVVVAAGAIVLVPMIADRLEAAPPLPASRGAYRRGGRPEPGSDAARAVFARDLSAFTIALDRLRLARGTPAETEALDAVKKQGAGVARASEAALGPAVTSYLRAVLDQSIAIVRSDDLVESAILTHVRSVDALDASLQSRGLGIYVDAQVAQELASGRHRVYLSSFTVEQVALYRSGERQVRALHLRRLDTLNFEHAMLGFTRDEIRDALVLLDRVEEHMVRDVLPAVAPGAAMRLVAAREPIDPWRDEVERAAAEDVRAEAAGVHADAAQLAALGALYAKRRDLFEGFARQLAPYQIQLRLPDRYGLDLEPYAGLDLRVSRDEWRQAEELVDALSGQRVLATLRTLEAPLVASIERHEVQHRLDALDEALDVCPAEVAALAPCDAPLGQRVLAELSAYVAELARGPGIARTNLAILARYLLDPDLVGVAESYAALVAFTGLARELHVPIPESLLGASGLDRAAAARLYQGLRTAPAPALADAAARVWARLYGRPLPPLRRAG